MCDSTRVNEPIQGSRAAHTVNHGHSTFVYTKPAQVPQRYPSFNPLGVQKDAFLFAAALENEEVSR